MNATEWLDTYGVAFDWSAKGFHLDHDGWEHQRFVVELTNGNGQVITFPWRQGLGVEEGPTPASTLPAIASDVRYGDLTWSDFADEFGHDEYDAPLSQYRTWEACRKMSDDLRGWSDMVDMFDDFYDIAEDES